MEAPDTRGTFDSEGAHAEVEDPLTGATSSGGFGGDVVAMAGAAEATVTAYDATVVIDNYVGRAA
ncbi:hypothetical protein [Actinoplanes sp. NPDC026623]|uniref:hypothetical protein n=1 Tax=Actinoplanes sp. NPDC026623 TaxID=3155610 RepID=UPI0033DA94FC